MDIRDQKGNPVDTQRLEKTEQELAEQYIKENDRVLELGARYGSVSCIINSKLKCKTNQVVVEPDDRVWDALERNKLANKCNFHIVKGFVSTKKLDLTELDYWHGGYGATFIENKDTKIPSFTLSEIQAKHNVSFNVLVADCEGFLEVFFDENPELYDSLRLVLFEADYAEKCNYEKIRNALKRKGFVELLNGHQNVWIKPEGIQLVIISCDEQRKRIMTQQMKALRMSMPFTIFQGYTPATSTDYLVDRDATNPESDTLLCCTRSHAAALHQFVTDYPEKEFALIIEDDAALLNTFEEELQRVMTCWATHRDDIDFVSLGYYPTKGTPPSLNSEGSLYWNLQPPTIWGTQSYIVKRSAAIKMASVLYHPTSTLTRAAMNHYIHTELSGKGRANKALYLSPDALLPLGWKQAVVFPMMAIELPVRSLITSSVINNSMRTWDLVFAEGGRKKRDFYSIPTSAVSILNSLNLSELLDGPPASCSARPGGPSLALPEKGNPSPPAPHSEGPVLTITTPVVTKKKRLIVCADNRSPYEGTDSYWTYCIMMTDTYSKVIGVDFKFELLKETKRHPSWEKIRIVQKYVNSYDEILWFDSDATVINKSVNVFEYIKTARESAWKRDVEQMPVIYAVSDKPHDAGGANAGIFLVDCSDKVKANAVLNDWWNDIGNKKYEQEAPWEQTVWSDVWKNTAKASYIRVADVWSMSRWDNERVFLHVPGYYKNARLSIVKRYFYKQLFAAKTKRIGILVRQQNYYTNGCGQNCIFLMQSFEALGYSVDLLVTHNKDKPAFVSDSIQLPYIDIRSVAFADYEIIVFGSEIPIAADNDRMKAAGVRRIMFNPCNVLDQFHNEHFLYKCRDTPMPLQEMTYKDIADEVWIIESHKKSTLTYMEVVNKNKIPVHAVPHIWSPLFLLGADGSVPMNRSHTGKKMDIVIMEPNMGYCKSGWLPLIICEKLYLDHPDAINQVFFFSTPESNSTAMGMIHSLDLWKSKKLRTMTRMPITDILAFFSDPAKHGDHLPVFLSHSVNSPLNYAYFDALYAGFPFVHNSPMLKERAIGYYYDDIESAAEAILKVPTVFSISESVKKARTFLAIQDPYSAESVAAFKRILDAPAKKQPVARLAAEGVVASLPALETNLMVGAKGFSVTTGPLLTIAQSPRSSSELKGLNKAFVINLDRRPDRYELFKTNHPSFHHAVTRVSAVDGKQLKLTPEIVHLFRNNDHNWMKAHIGCSSSHYNLWKRVAESEDGAYLLFEDDVKCVPEFVDRVNECVRRMPADTDILYLGGVLPCNRSLYKQVVETVNDVIGRIKLRPDTNTRFFPFCACSYILTRQGALKLLQYVHDNGMHQASDILMCRRYRTMNLYMSIPLLAYTTQEENPDYATSDFDNVNNQNTYDSDIANTKEHFSAEDLKRASTATSLQILVVSACDKRKAILEQQFKELDISYPIRYLEAKVLDAELPDYVPDSATDAERRMILSTRSHIRAVELAGLDESPEFSLIIEDDIALHKTEFKSTLTNIVETYDTKVAPHSSVISLGWIPCNNYSFYPKLENPTVLNASYAIHQRFTPGTQAYLIKRSVANKYTPLLKHKTHKALCDTILAQKNPMITRETQLFVFDDFGTKLLNQCILFPPIVIEQPNVSLIRGTGDNPYWTQFFKGHEAVRDQYWTVHSRHAPSNDVSIA